MLAPTDWSGGEENMENGAMSPKVLREGKGRPSASGESLIVIKGVGLVSKRADGGVLSLLLAPKAKVAGVLVRTGIWRIVSIQVSGK